MTEEKAPVKRKYKRSTIITESMAADKPKSPKSSHYVNNAEFYQALVERRALMDEWRANGSEGKKPKISDAIGKAIQAIATNLARKYNFANIPYRDEMTLSAIEHCIRYVDSFDIHNSANPFSYFTQTCYYQFIGVIATEEKEQYIKFKAIMTSALVGEIADSQEESVSVDNLPAADTLKYMEDFIARYETKRDKPKEEKKVKPKKGVDSILEDV